MPLHAMEEFCRSVVSPRHSHAEPQGACSRLSTRTGYHLGVLGRAVTCDFCLVPSPPPTETPHVQYERLGSDVTLPCGTASWDAAVTWRVNGTDLAPDLLNGSQLVLRSLELGHSGLYACFHRDSWHLHHQILLHVGCKCDSQPLV